MIHNHTIFYYMIHINHTIFYYMIKLNGLKEEEHSNLPLNRFFQQYLKRCTIGRIYMGCQLCNRIVMGFYSLQKLKGFSITWDCQSVQYY